MPDNTPTLHLVCGKIAAGKSTLAGRLAREPGTILICEDAWLSALYPGEILTIDDYVRCSSRLRDAMGDHIVALLRSGLSVVLDFPANTVHLRQWMRTLFEAAGVAHRLHYLEIPDAVCKARLRRRNEEGAHEFAPGDAEFDRITSFFQPPSSGEGFDVEIHPDS